MFAGSMTAADRQKIFDVIREEEDRTVSRPCAWCGKTFPISNQRAVPQNQVCPFCLEEEGHQ